MPSAWAGACLSGIREIAPSFVSGCGGVSKGQLLSVA